MIVGSGANADRYSRRVHPAKASTRCTSGKVPWRSRYPIKQHMIISLIIPYTIRARCVTIRQLSASKFKTPCISVTWPAAVMNETGFDRRQLLSGTSGKVFSQVCRRTWRDGKASRINQSVRAGGVPSARCSATIDGSKLHHTKQPDGIWSG